MVAQPDIGGYYRLNEEERFAWDINGKVVWYSVIKEDLSLIGFTSSKSGKKELINYLRSSIDNKEKIILFGVWTGQYSTSLFVLDPIKAIKQLEKVV